MMKPTKEEIRDKIVTNGFTLKEFLSLRRDYKDTRKIFHPDLIKELSFQDVIYKKAREALSPIKYLPLLHCFFLFLLWFRSRTAISLCLFFSVCLVCGIYFQRQGKAK